MDIIIPIPNSVPGSIRYSENISRTYELLITLDLSVQNISMKLPLQIYEWSPQIKDIFPDFVNMNQIKNQYNSIREIEKNPLDESDSQDNSLGDEISNDENLLI